VLDLDTPLNDQEQEAAERIATAKAARHTGTHAAENRHLAGEPVVPTSEPSQG
jgi:hypothetical protein